MYLHQKQQEISLDLAKVEEVVVAANGVFHVSWEGVVAF